MHRKSFRGHTWRTSTWMSSSMNVLSKSIFRCSIFQLINCLNLNEKIKFENPKKLYFDNEIRSSEAFKFQAEDHVAIFFHSLFAMFFHSFFFLAVIFYRMYFFLVDIPLQIIDETKLKIRMSHNIKNLLWNNIAFWHKIQNSMFSIRVNFWCLDTNIFNSFSSIVWRISIPQYVRPNF